MKPNGLCRSGKQPVARRTKLPARTNEQLEENLGYKLPVEFVPVLLLRGWAATATATRTSLPISPPRPATQPLESHRFVPERYSVLVSELSMVEATPELLALVAKKVPQNRIAI